MKHDPRQGSLMSEEDLRHPMWTRPEAVDLTSFDYALRRKIHSAVQPFDGRPNSERVILFCQEVWDLTGHGLGFVRLIGEIAWLKAKRVRSLRSTHVASHRRDREVISRLGDEFIAHLDHHVRP